MKIHPQATILQYQFDSGISLDLHYNAVQEGIRDAQKRATMSLPKSVRLHAGEVHTHKDYLQYCIRVRMVLTCWRWFGRGRQ